YDRNCVLQVGQQVVPRFIDLILLGVARNRLFERKARMFTGCCDRRFLLLVRCGRPLQNCDQRSLSLFDAWRSRTALGRKSLDFVWNGLGRLPHIDTPVHCTSSPTARERKECRRFSAMLSKDRGVRQWPLKPLARVPYGLKDSRPRGSSHARSPERPFIRFA